MFYFDGVRQDILCSMSFRCSFGRIFNALTIFRVAELLLFKQLQIIDFSVNQSTIKEMSD